jgi:hypothetical protein
MIRKATEVKMERNMEESKLRKKIPNKNLMKEYIKGIRKLRKNWVAECGKEGRKESKFEKAQKSIKERL